MVGSGTALSNLNYVRIANPSDLTQYNAWTKVSGTSNIYNTTNGKVRINITTPQAALEIIGYNDNLYKVKFDTILSTGISGLSVFTKNSNITNLSNTLTTILIIWIHYQLIQHYQLLI